MEEVLEYIGVYVQRKEIIRLEGRVEGTPLIVEFLPEKDKWRVLDAKKDFFKNSNRGIPVEHSSIADLSDQPSSFAHFSDSAKLSVARG